MTRVLPASILQTALAAILCLMYLLTFALAVNPDEVLDDKGLEARARSLSAELRCMVCQNQSIDDSDAELAKDLRVLVRKRLVEGDSDAQVIDFVVSRYGDFVLLKPRFSAKNFILWATPIFVLLIGAILLVINFRPAHQKSVNSELSEDEKNRLKQLLKD